MAKTATVKDLSREWVTRGARHLSFSARLNPWFLMITAFQLGGETVYNYFKLDDHQRWLDQCCWGMNDKGWSWDTHAQLFAEAILRPIITDQGIVEPPDEFAKVRSLVLSFPGVSMQSLADNPIRLTAQLQRDNVSGLLDVGEIVRNQLRLIGDNPLTLQLNLPYEWCGTQSLLLMRLSVQPELAVEPLKIREVFLHYRIPLDLASVSEPVNGIEGIAHIGEVNDFELKVEDLDE